MHKVISQPPRSFDRSLGNACGGDILPPREQDKTKPFFKLGYGKGAQTVQRQFQGWQMQSAVSAPVPGEVPTACIPLLRDTCRLQGWQHRAGRSS